MGQGEEISRQEKVVSSWSGSGGKSLFVCPQRSGQEAQVFASSLSGRLVSWGAGIGRCDDWALMGRVSSVTGVRQEVWTVLMFRDSLLAASHHNQHSWSHSFCFISSQLSLVPSFLIPIPMSTLFLLFQFYCGTPSSCLKVRGGVCKRLCGVVQAAMWCCASGYVVVCKRLCGGGPWDFSVSPRPLFGFLGLGLRGLGPGLDKNSNSINEFWSPIKNKTLVNEPESGASSAL